MRLPRLIAVTALLALPAVATAQSPAYVVLKIRNTPGSLGSPDANGRVTLTLASGDRVTVSVLDIDIERMKSLTGMPGNTSSSTPPMQELLLSPSMAETTLRAKCEEEWNTDFRMRSYCESQQKDALAALRQRTISTSDTAAIRRQCSSEWPRDFRMMNYCEEQQLQALGSLGGSSRPSFQAEPQAAGPIPTRLLVLIRLDADGWRIANQNPSYAWQDCTAFAGESSAKLSALEPGGAVIVRRSEFKPTASSTARLMVTCTAGGTTYTATSTR